MKKQQKKISQLDNAHTAEEKKSQNNKNKNRLAKNFSPLSYYKKVKKKS